MLNVNLATKSQKSYLPGDSFLGKNLIVVLIALFLTGAVYLGLVLYKKKLTTDIGMVKAEYKTKYDLLLAGKAKEVVDFQNRLDLTKELVKQERNTSLDLVEMEKTITEGVYLDNYNYNEIGKTLVLTYLTNDFKNVPKQALNLKQSSYFTNVVVGEAKYSESDGNIKFIINLNIK